MTPTNILILGLIALLAIVAMYALYRSPPMPGAQLSTPKQWLSDMLYSGVQLIGWMALALTAVFFAAMSLGYCVGVLSK